MENNGKSQESLRVTLAKIPSSGDMEPEMATADNQTGLPMEERDTNAATKPLTHNLSCLQDMQG